MRRTIYSKNFSKPIIFLIDTSKGAGSSWQIRYWNAFVGRIDWGDGNVEYFNNPVGSFFINHTYSVGGIYTVMISMARGNLLHYEGFDNAKILKLIDWGEGFILIGGTFNGGTNIDLSETIGKPEIISSLANAFAQCKELTTINGLENWNLVGVTSITRVVNGSSKFNQDIYWNLPNCTSADYAFENATSLRPANFYLNMPNVTNVSPEYLIKGAPFDYIGMNFYLSIPKSSTGRGLGYQHNLRPNTFYLNYESAIDLAYTIANATFGADLSTMVMNKNATLNNFFNAANPLYFTPALYDAFLLNCRNTFVGTGRTNTNKNANFGGAKRTAVGTALRAELIADGWIITDAGEI